MVVISDYAGLVAHYRERMNACATGTPERSAYEYVASTLASAIDRNRQIQREHILAFMHCIETFPWFAVRIGANQSEQLIQNTIYVEVVQCLKRYLASGS